MLSVFILFIVKRRASCRRNLRQLQCNDVYFHTYNALNEAVVPRARKIFKRYDKKKVEAINFETQKKNPSTATKQSKDFNGCGKAIPSRAVSSQVL